MLKIKQLSCYGFVKIHLFRLKPAQIKIDPFIRLLNSHIPTERIATPEKVSGCITFFCWHVTVFSWHRHSNQTKLISKILQNCTRPRISIDDETIRLLERLSLVDFCNVEGKLNLYCRVGEKYNGTILVIWHTFIRLFKVYVD